VKVLSRLVPAIGVGMLAMTALAAPAFASTGAKAGDSSNTGAVFVQTDNIAGNAVVAYHRASDGTLTLAGTYPTGGRGGVLAGSMVDHLASQGSLTYDDTRGLLFAVNAGSDTVSVFGVFGDRLELRQVIWSGGAFPVSVTVHGNHAYVLDALGGGTLYGYRITGGHLTPIPGSSRPLGLNPNATPQFTTTPGQVAYTPDGSRILVTTKGNGSDVIVFAVRPDGRLSRSPVVNSEPGAVPFAISYDDAGHVLIAEAGPSALATFALSAGGALTQLAVADTGQTATCWVAGAGGYFYTSNAGSGSVSGYTVDGAGQLTALGNTKTDPGTVDASAAGGFLYVQAGAAGIVDEFAVGAGGALTSLGSVTVTGAAGGEGIVAL
jgi:6-phosphogluconolactonase (cycloisomerase 2 family)